MMNVVSAGAGLVALLAVGTASGTYVEYTTYDNNDCVTVRSVSVYAGVPGQCVWCESARRPSRLNAKTQMTTKQRTNGEKIRYTVVAEKAASGKRRYICVREMHLLVYLIVVHTR